MTEATAFAPASVGNVAVGFDILGLCLASPGDTVRVVRIAEPTVRMGTQTGCAGPLPTDAPQNTAGAALIALRSATGVPFGFEVHLDKGIPLGSGMGGSAASAVGAVVAAAALLPAAISADVLLGAAVAGEAVASGAPHADNAAPCLFGGLRLVGPSSASWSVPIPVPDLVCVVVRPAFRLDTRASRAVLPLTIPLASHVAQSARLARFIAGCFHGDTVMVAAAFGDELVEPHRAALIPGFHAVKQAALDAGALGSAISGGGPSVFALCAPSVAEAVKTAMVAAFAQAGQQSQAYASPMAAPGARIIPS